MLLLVGGGARAGGRERVGVGEGERNERARHRARRPGAVEGNGGFAECQIGGTRQSQFSSPSVVIWHSAKL